MDNESRSPVPDMSDTRSRDSGEITAGQSGDTKRKQVSSVYFVQCMDETGPVKVGIACSPVDRTATMQIGCPYALKLLGSFRLFNAKTVEKRVHRMLESTAMHGEWFAWSEMIPKAMKAVAEWAAADAVGRIVTEREVKATERWTRRPARSKPQIACDHPDSDED